MELKITIPFCIFLLNGYAVYLPIEAIPTKFDRNLKNL